MANVGTHTANSAGLAIVAIAGVDDNDIIMELDDAEPYDEFFFMTVAGLVDVDVSLDGINFAVAVAFTDRQSTAPATKVIITAAGLLYSIKGQFKAIRVRQNTAVDATGGSMTCRRRP